MPRYFLNPGVFAVIVADDLIVLDVARDTYGCLPLTDELIRLDLENATIECGTDLGDALCDESLASRISPSRQHKRRPPPALPRQGLVTSPSLRPQAEDICALAGTWLRLVRSPRTLPEMLAELGQAVPHQVDPDVLTVRVATYRRYLPALPYVGRCLFQCRLLRAYLYGADIQTTWVFGVRTYPFAAHCWLQLEDISLTDGFETLADLHPIMAV